MEDLYTYIKNDSEINMDDYFANVFDAISIDGKLPYITNGVSISTMLANSSALVKVGMDAGQLGKGSGNLGVKFHK